MRIISSAPVIDVAKFQQGKIPVGGETLEMDPEQIRVIAQDLRFLVLWVMGIPTHWKSKFRPSFWKVDV